MLFFAFAQANFLIKTKPEKQQQKKQRILPGVFSLKSPAVKGDQSVPLTKISSKVVQTPKIPQTFQILFFLEKILFQKKAVEAYLW